MIGLSSIRHEEDDRNQDLPKKQETMTKDTVTKNHVTGLWVRETKDEKPQPQAVASHDKPAPQRPTLHIPAEAFESYRSAVTRLLNQPGPGDQPVFNVLTRLYQLHVDKAAQAEDNKPVTLSVEQVKAAVSGEWPAIRQTLLVMQTMGLVILWTGIDGIYAVQLTHPAREIGKAASKAPAVMAS